MRANHEAACDAIKKSVDEAILAGAWRAYNAGEEMAKILAWYTDETQAWHEDAENLRDAINRNVDASILAGAWRAFNAAEAMSEILAWYTDETQAWHDDADKLRVILQERSEGP